MSYQNLKAELVRHDITQRSVAKFLGMSEKNLNLKLSERVPMTVSEAKAMRDQFIPDATLDYLLESDGRPAGTAESAHAQVGLIEDALRRDGLLDDEAREVVAGLHRGIDEMPLKG